MADDKNLPMGAYSLLEDDERSLVDEYVQYAIGEQHRKRERIIHALYLPIPSEYIRRSKSALYRPLLRAAVAERIREAAEVQDISPSRVINEHAVIAFSDISDYIEPSGFGDFRIKNLTDILPSKRGAVKSLETKPTAYGLQTKIILHDKHPSLKAMGEMMGIVASDKAPTLTEYVRPPQALDAVSDVPEQVYMSLLESV
jgi:hypothetical protein